MKVLTIGKLLIQETARTCFQVFRMERKAKQMVEEMQKVVEERGKPQWWPTKPWTEQDPATRKIVLAIPCPCGLQYRILPGQPVLSEWTDRIIQRRKGEAS